jgi:hypothetical protein
MRKRLRDIDKESRQGGKNPVTEIRRQIQANRDTVIGEKYVMD